MTPDFSPLNFADVNTYVASGSIEDAMAWVGHESTRVAPFPVNEAQIGYFCSLTQDRNENYWNPTAAQQRFGSIISPPGMLLMWSFPLPWTPSGKPEHSPFLGVEVPLPGDTLINVSTDTQFHDVMRVGDVLTFHDRVTAVSEEKTTALGVGHFVTTVARITTDNGNHVATHENVVYRYQAHDPAPPTGSDVVPPLADSDIAVVTMPVTTTRAILGVAATRDFFPGHHDRDYAKSQGARDMYLNTIFYHGFVDRVVTDWAGPDAMIVRRKLRMLTPACVGDVLTAGGTITRDVQAGDGHSAVVDVSVHADDGIAATAQVFVSL